LNLYDLFLWVWVVGFFFFEILGKKMLVPLTASLYVPGTLDDADKVLVDIGTGYFVEVSWLQLAAFFFLVV
jgi:prefoldin alpha subunit